MLPPDLRLRTAATAAAVSLAAAAVAAALKGFSALFITYHAANGKKHNPSQQRTYHECSHMPPPNFPAEILHACLYAGCLHLYVQRTALTVWTEQQINHSDDRQKCEHRANAKHARRDQCSYLVDAQ